MTVPPLPDTLTPAEVAALLGVDPATIRNWCKSGAASAGKVGGRWAVDVVRLATTMPGAHSELARRWHRLHTRGAPAVATSDPDDPDPMAGW